MLELIIFLSMVSTVTSLSPRGGAMTTFSSDTSISARSFVDSISRSPRVTLNLQDVDLRELVRILGQHAGVTIYADPGVKGTASLNVENLPFASALEAILEPRGYVVRKFPVEGETDAERYFVYDPASTRRIFVAAARGRLTVDIQRFQLGDVIAEIARESRRSIVSVGDLGAQITISLHDVPFGSGLEEIALAGGCRLEIVGKGESAVYRVIPDAMGVALQPRQFTSPIRRPFEIVALDTGRIRLRAADASIKEVVMEIAEMAGLSLAIDGDVAGTVTLLLDSVAPEEAIRALAAQAKLRAHVESGGMIRIDDPRKEKRVRIVQQAGLVALDLQNAPLAEVLREFGARTGINVSAPRCDTPVTISAQSSPAPASLRLLAEAVGLVVIEEADRFRLVLPGASPRGVAKIDVTGGALSIDCADAEIAMIARQLSSASGKNFLVETGVTGAITGRLENVAFDDGLKTFLASKGFRLRRTNGIYRISSGAASAATGQDAIPNLEIAMENGRLTIDVTDADLGALLRQIAEAAHLDIALYGAVRDKVNIVLRGERLETALAKILLGTRFGYTIADSMLTVGDISQPGPMAALALREEIIPLQYFSAREIPALLPAEIPGAQVRVIEAQNALLITGRPEIIEKARRFIARLDRAPTQIQIEGLLVEYRTTDAFTHNLSSLVVTGQTPDIATTTPSSGAGSFTVTDLKNFHNPQFQFSLTSLVEKGEASIRARPSISTVSGREAKINVQSQENFRVTQPSSTQGVPLVQIQSINSGITLRITPFVSADAGDAVTMDIFFEDSSPGDRTADGLPAIATRNAQNRIVLRSDRTAVIGGLIRNDVAKSRGGFPILADLPIIGSLFGRKLRSDRRSTLVFYITPRIITSDTSVARTFSERGVIVEPEAIAPGVSKGESAPPHSGAASAI